MEDSPSRPPEVDRRTFRVLTFAQADAEVRRFWHKQSFLERMRHVERLRELNYGPEVINQGLQRVLTVFERPRS